MQKEKSEQQNDLLNYWGNKPRVLRHQGIKSTKSFVTSPRGLTLFNSTWQPLDTPTRAAICMVHGYGNNISWTFQSTPIFLAQNGFACFALDMEGHDQSDGLCAFMPSIDNVVEDCVAFFDSVAKTDADGLGRWVLVWGVDGRADLRRMALMDCQGLRTAAARPMEGMVDVRRGRGVFVTMEGRGFILDNGPGGLDIRRINGGFL